MREGSSGGFRSCLPLVVAVLLFVGLMVLVSHLFGAGSAITLLGLFLVLVIVLATVEVIQTATHTRGGVRTLTGAVIALGLIVGAAAGSALPPVVCTGIGFAFLHAIDRRRGNG